MSAVVMSIYSILDSVAIGQSEGPAGSAALAAITPLYGLFAFLSILCGVGGDDNDNELLRHGKSTHQAAPGH